MIQRKRTFFLGIFIFLLPFLGFPSSWKTIFLVIAGLTLISWSVTVVLPRKSVVKRTRRKEKVTPVYTENVPIPPKPDVTHE